MHPRYGSVYNGLYGNDSGESTPAGTFGVRLFLAFLLFAGFVMMDRQDYKVFNVGSERIVQEIETDFDVAEVWKKL